MNAFLWSLIIPGVLANFGRIYAIYKDEPLVASRGANAIDLCYSVMMICWAVSYLK